ncbi:transposase [Streptomyces uncialis]|uniref:transposase n=1 Tax=Streptomyces uncialis TaxID=1048205 RepID=UPI00380322E6
MTLVHQGVLRDAFAELSHFRSELYACLTARGDALFELCEALLCTDGPVRTLVDLALAPEHRRGHGAQYGGLNQGRIDVAWLHPRLTRRAAWLDHDGPLHIIEGTVIRLVVKKLPSGGVNKPVWLWWSRVGATKADVDRCWQSFLRRFDIEHTFRLFKQTLGWTKPRLRSSEAADRWTWLVIAAYAQLRLARPLATDLRRPWEKPAEPNKLTPSRVRRGFRNLRTRAGSPTGAPKPSRPGPGRPLGSKNRRPAARHDVGRVLATGEAYKRPAHHQVGTKARRLTPVLS